MSRASRALSSFTASDVRRFLAKLEPDPQSECLLWRGGVTYKAGHPELAYAVFWLNGCAVRGHRAAVRLFRGLDPGDFQGNHTCYTRLCVNPYHVGGLDESEHARESNRARWRPEAPALQAFAAWPEEPPF